MQHCQPLLRLLVLSAVFGAVAFSQQLQWPNYNVPTPLMVGSSSIRFNFSGIQPSPGVVPRLPYSLEVSGSLPPGLNASGGNSNGSIPPSLNGSPSKAGTYTFTVNAKDATLPIPNRTRRQTFTVIVTALPPVFTPLALIKPVTAGSTAATVNLAKNVGLGNEPSNLQTYTASVVSGILPDQTQLAIEPNLQNLNLVGDFLTPGRYDFTAIVADASQPPLSSAPQSFTVLVLKQPLAINPAPTDLFGLTTLSKVPAVLPGGLAPRPFSPYASAGLPPYQLSIQGSLPPGLTPVLQSPTPFVQNANVFTGTPTNPGTYSYLVQAADSGKPASVVSQPYTTSVIAPSFFQDPQAQPNKGTSPSAIALAPDGTLWLAQRSAINTGTPIVYGVANVTPGGILQHETLLTYPSLSTAPDRNPQPGRISVGPDGSLWFIAGGSYVYQVKADGTIGAAVRIQYLAGSTLTNVSLTGIVSGGSEGGVWFTGYAQVTANNRVGVVGRVDPRNPTSSLLVKDLPASSEKTSPTPLDILPDPANSKLFWYLDSTTASNVTGQALLGQFTVSGSSLNFSLPKGCKNPLSSQLECRLLDASGAALAPASATSLHPLMAPFGQDIWFQTVSGTASIAGAISATTGTITIYPNSVVGVAGFDGAMWGIEDSKSRNSGSPDLIVRTTPSGETSTFAIDPPLRGTSVNLLGAAPQTGPDGALWFTDQGNQRVLKILPSLSFDCANVSSRLTIGVPVSVTCAARGGKPDPSGKYTYGLSGALPPGLTSVQNADGTLTVSGTPSAAGVFFFTATDGSSPSQSATRVFTSIPLPLQLSCGILPTGYVSGTTYAANDNLSCNAAGGSAPYTFTVTGNVPPELQGAICNPQTPSCFQFTGLLDPYVSGMYNFTVNVADSKGASVSQDASMTVTLGNATVSCASTTQAVVGEAYQQSCFGSRGSTNLTYSAASPLPDGLTLDSATGIITGTPTTSGKVTVKVQVNDPASNFSTFTTFIINVVAPAQVFGLVCDFSPRAQAGQPYSSACTPYGGTPAYTYAVSGTLPPGLSLQNHTISGTPSTPGSYIFTVAATDSAGIAALQAVSLVVHPSSLTILTATLPALSNLAYAVRPLVEGGTQPYAFSITGGALPLGLVLDPAAGLISGTPDPGNFQFTLQVQDAAGSIATRTYSGTVPVVPLIPSLRTYPLLAKPNNASGPINAHNGLNGLASGLDGTLWFTALDQVGGNVIGSLSSDGKTFKAIVSSNALTSPDKASGSDLVLGSDGNLWVAQRHGNTLAQQSVDLTKPTRQFVLRQANSLPSQVASAPNGAIWFTETGLNQIGRVDASGKILEFSIPTANSGPTGIAVAPDNSVWFTEQTANKIGSLSSDGTVKNEFAIPTANSKPTSIVFGPDNAFWFTETGGNGKIGRIDLTGSVTDYGMPSNATFLPQAITAGSDGALYFTDRMSDQIGRITVAGVFSQAYQVDTGSALTGITAGPDGSIWFGESASSKIGRLNLVYPVSVTCTLPSPPVVAQSAFSGSCTATGGNAPYTFAFDSTTNPPPGVIIDPNTGTLSGTLSAPGKFTFNVVAQDSSPSSLNGRSIAYTVVVSPLPLTSTCTLPIARWLTSYSGSCSGVNGFPPYTYVVTAGSLPAGLSIDAASGSVAGVPTALGNSTLTLQITDSNTPPSTVTQNANISVMYGNLAPNGPLLSLGGLPGSQAPGIKLNGVTVQSNINLAQTLPGTATLTFNLAGDIPTLGVNKTTPAGYIDPALQFVDAAGNSLGRSYPFTLEPGTSSVTLPAIAPGTVGGSINIVLNTDVPQGGAAISIPDPKAIIEPGSVQFTNVTSSGFDVEFVAIETQRTGKNITITFNPAAGAEIHGQTVFRYDVFQMLNTWFISDTGQKYGGSLSLSFPFQFDGQVTAIGSATVQLDNSDPVSGNR